jgi:2-alkyl-3-oxoalkanoate reductase
MKTLVTGGAGFLAGHIIDKLTQAGHKVRTVELPSRNVERLKSLDVEILTGDLCDADTATKACEGMDVVFNCAALLASIGPWKRFWAINVELVDNLLHGCKKAGVKRFVQVSSPSAVFDGTDHIDADETLPYPKRFLSYYCATKAESEKRVMAANGPDLETVAIRPHSIWGPRDGALFPRILSRSRAGRLFQVGDGTNIISTLYVENGADALVLAATAKKARGNIYFITDREPINLWAFVRRIIHDLDLPPIKGKIPYSLAYSIGAAQEAAWNMFKLKGEPTITRYSAAELAKNHSYSIERARRDLGYEPAITREQGLERFYKWAREEML